MATRSAPRALNKDARTIDANAKADKARKAESKKALEVQTLRDMAKANYDQDGGVMFETWDGTAFNEAIATSKTAKAAWTLHMKAVTAIKETQAVYEVETEEKGERDHGAENLEAAKVEAAATGMTLLEACDSMGIDPITGQPQVVEKPRYSGPMLALVAARKTYVKAPNGVQCNGDELALLLGTLKREDVLRVCIEALDLPGNPYLHLNPGQQSMNLRNKLRQAVKTGNTTLLVIGSVIARLVK